MPSLGDSCLSSVSVRLRRLSGPLPPFPKRRGAPAQENYISQHARAAPPSRFYPACPAAGRSRARPSPTDPLSAFVCTFACTFALQPPPGREPLSGPSVPRPPSPPPPCLPRRRCGPCWTSSWARPGTVSRGGGPAGAGAGAGAGPRRVHPPGPAGAGIGVPGALGPPPGPASRARWAARRRWSLAARPAGLAAASGERGPRPAVAR